MPRKLISRGCMIFNCDRLFDPVSGPKEKKREAEMKGRKKSCGENPVRAASTIGP